MVFVDHPWIPMDNSEAETRMRIAALGRKSYYGSGSVASGHFTAWLFSIFQTLKLWDVNPRKWLTTLAPILITFSRSVRSDHFFTDFGKARRIKKLPRL
jgi:hypothetical protein